MLLRKLRWLSAGLLAAAAFLGAPSAARADITILIEEVDAGGNAIAGTSNTFSGSSVNGYSTPNFTGIQVGVTSNSGFNTPTASISTGFSYLGRNEVSPESNAVGLRIVVTDTFNRPPGGNPATVNTTVGASNGSTGLVGLNTITNQTTVLDTGGNTIGGTGVASVVSPSGVASGPQSGSIAALPPSGTQFQIQQTIVSRITSDGAATVPAGQTYGGTAASGTQPLSNPVPAPAGLVLALTGLPLLGLYRARRRKADATAAG
ncbi:MAG: hypothetical protein K2P78_09770 [Gemmataceae bacterium]|nr:hypothetical protein [Gemmataceae bacterium]